MTLRIIQVCPNCSNSTFIHKELEEQDWAFECLECGELIYPENLNTVVIEDTDLEKHGLVDINTFKELASKVINNV